MKTIFFDIETGPLPESELLALLPPFDPAEVKTGNRGGRFARNERSEMMSGTVLLANRLTAKPRSEVFAHGL